MTPEPPDAPPADTERLRILNWDAGIKPIDDETKLIRYMKLSTFLLLLDNQLFIPSVQVLQSLDQHESRIPSQQLAGYWSFMRDIIEPHWKWLFKRAWPYVELKEGRDKFDAGMLPHLTETWLKQLAQRRCIWCWNRSVEQLDAMWKLYGQRGVAVISTVGKIWQALTEAGAEGIVAPVRYFTILGPEKPERHPSDSGAAKPESSISV